MNTYSLDTLHIQSATLGNFERLQKTRNLLYKQTISLKR